MIHGLLSKRKGREEYAIILEDKREPRLLRVKAGFDLANIFYFTDRPKSEDILQSRKHGVTIAPTRGSALSLNGSSYEKICSDGQIYKKSIFV
jgi:hypothetical protein